MEYSMRLGSLLFLLVVLLVLKNSNGEDPYRFFTWNVTYGDIYPLGVKQQVIYYCSKFFSFSLLFLFFFNVKYLVNIFVYEMSGDFDKWAVSWTTD
jgi:hypothetical protein